MKKSTIFTMIFLAMLVLPLIFVERKTSVASEIDNRRLNEFPEIGTENFFKNFETALNDRIGFRTSMVQGYGVVNNLMFGYLAHPFYSYGQDKYVFFPFHTPNKFGEFHEAFADMVMKLKNYCEERGCKFYFIFNPEKLSVYRRYLPKGYNYEDVWVDSLMARIEGYGVKCVNNTELLTELSFTEQVYNRKYDAGHWNDLGCFHGTNALFALIHNDIPAVKPLDTSDFVITTTTAHYLPVSRFVVDEQVPKFTYKAGYKAIDSVYSGEIVVNKSFPHFHYHINNAENANELPKTLVFQGSYYNRGPQFLIGGTREYIGVHNYQNVLNIDYYFNIFQPEVVIFDVAEYVFVSQYFDFKKMTELTFTPGISPDKISQILQSAPRSNQNAKLQILSGKSIDNISIYLGDNIKYAYLINGNEICDLSKQGILYNVGTRHNAINNDSLTMIYTVDNQDNAQLWQCTSAQLEQLSTYFSSSANTAINGDTITMTTPISDNRFNAFEIQLFSSEPHEYISTFFSTSNSGVAKCDYVHEQPSGRYIFRLKANSNKQDEAAEFDVYLEKGDLCTFEFTVDEISEKRVSLHGLRVMGVKNKFDYFPNNNIEALTIIDSLASKGVKIDSLRAYTLTTDVAGNGFDNVNIQLIKGNHEEYITTLDSHNKLSPRTYIYHCNQPSGVYTIRLKANSNLSDEYYDFVLNLKQGLTYGITYYPTMISAHTVKVKDFGVWLLL